MNPLVCVPTRSSVHALTMASVFRTCAGFPGPVGFQTFLAEPVDHARNLCVQYFLAGTWTHLFFVDSDIELPDDAMLRLLAADVPIASGLYPLNLAEEGLCLSAAVETAPQRVRFITHRPESPTQADATGLGCCLIRRDVLEAVSQPWFRFTTREDDGELIGEDVEFFLRVREELGIRPVIVPEVLCGHHREVDLGSLWRTAEASFQAAPVTATNADPAASITEPTSSTVSNESIATVAAGNLANRIPGIPRIPGTPGIAATSTTPPQAQTPDDAEAAAVLATVDELTAAPGATRTGPSIV